MRSLGREALVRRLGKEGEVLYGLSVGLDCASFVRSKKIESETVLNWDINDVKKLVQYVQLTSDKLCFQLKGYILHTRRLTVIIRYADDRIVQKTMPLTCATNKLSAIGPIAVQAFRELYQSRIAVKSIRMVVKNASMEKGQLGLFETAFEKRERQKNHAITAIRKKMGFDSILSASFLDIARANSRANINVEAAHSSS